MTAQSLPRTNRGDRLRVLEGRRFRKPSIAPWMIMVVLAVVAFLGLGFARISLDRSAFELAELNRSIDEQAALNERLRFAQARLESPARIAPLADELGLVIPGDPNPLLVNLDVPSPLVAESEGRGGSQ